MYWSYSEYVSETVKQVVTEHDVKAYAEMEV